jgi:hypothetical protein
MTSHEAFTRILKMVLEMTPEDRDKWLEENTEQIETDFGTFIVVKPEWVAWIPR